MQKHELNEFIINLVGATKGMQIITAVDAYSSASNGEKPIVSGSALADKVCRQLPEPYKSQIRKTIVGHYR